jgi:hypothetical protein
MRKISVHVYRRVDCKIGEIIEASIENINKPIAYLQQGVYKLQNSVLAHFLVWVQFWLLQV